MQLNLKNHRANIFEKNPFDVDKTSIVFVPGAGMDHRVADLISPNPKIFNKVLSIDLPGHGGSTPTGAKSVEEYSNFISK